MYFTTTILRKSIDKTQLLRYNYIKIKVRQTTKHQKQKAGNNMRNEFKTTLQVKRIDICNLMLACLAAKELANDEGKKWDRLHDELKRQLGELDAQLDELQQNY